MLEREIFIIENCYDSCLINCSAEQHYQYLGSLRAWLMNSGTFFHLTLRSGLTTPMFPAVVALWHGRIRKDYFAKKGECVGTERLQNL